MSKSHLSAHILSIHTHNVDLEKQTQGHHQPTIYSDCIQYDPNSVHTQSQPPVYSTSTHIESICTKEASSVNNLGEHVDHHHGVLEEQTSYHPSSVHTTAEESTYT